MRELTEHVGLGERSENCDLITEDLARWPRDTSSRRVDTKECGNSVAASFWACVSKETKTGSILNGDHSPINDQFTASSHVVNGVLENLGRSCSFNDNTGNSSALLVQVSAHEYILEAIWVLILDLLELNFWI
jgi:hypothetical protein